MEKRSLRLVVVLSVLALAFGLATTDVSASQWFDVSKTGARIVWTPVENYQAAVLTIRTPSGNVIEKTLEPGALSLAASDLPEDGLYAWELVLTPVLNDKAKSAVAGARGENAEKALREKGVLPPMDALKISGHARVAGGVFVDAASVEEEQPAVAGDSNPTPDAVSDQDVPAKDQVFADDLIVQGSECVGTDCVNNENFGFDTLRLKENNLRIRAYDTSNSGSFPTEDWQITFNDSANGGASKFSIDDIDFGKTPFTIEANAPSNSLYVDDGGRVGLGTATPVVELHIKDGDTPTLRLEQDGSSGFTPQTWDVAGNETNFFVRDVTNGSTLPFRIRPTAPSNSIYIDTDGSVGMGTNSPDEQLHVKGSSTTTDIAKFQSGGAETKLLITNDNLNADWAFSVSNSDQFRISKQGTGGAELTIDANGNCRARGDFFANGTQLNVPDYVFDPGYQLTPISELVDFIDQNGHLPDVPSADEIASAGGVNMTQMQMKLLQKIEELTLYVARQDSQIQELKEQLANLQGQGAEGAAK